MDNFDHSVVAGELYMKERGSREFFGFNRQEKD
jgi:hypothetical protein